jgi:hypothetical protein
VATGLVCAVLFEGLLVWGGGQVPARALAASPPAVSTPAPAGTATPTQTPVEAPTQKPAEPPTQTSAETPAATATPAPADTPTPADTPEPTPTPAETPEPTPTPAETPEPTPTPAETPEPTPVAADSWAPAPTPTTAPAPGTTTVQHGAGVSAPTRHRGRAARPRSGSALRGRARSRPIRRWGHRSKEPVVSVTAPSVGQPAPVFSGTAPLSAWSGALNPVAGTSRVPAFLLPIYAAAGTQYRVPWEVLAAINAIETDYGRNLRVSQAGAVGWMQFLPSTWSLYGVDADDDGSKDPYDPVDAVFAAARYLRAAGAERDLRRAIFAYNHADWYVESVLQRAAVIAAANHHAARARSLLALDVADPSVGQILLMSKQTLTARVLSDPGISIYPCGRRDIEDGEIDRRVLATLEFLAASGLEPTVTSLQCGHGYFTSSGNVSHHSSGNAVDIAAINGVPILGNQGEGSITERTVRRLLSLQGTMKPDQIISLMSFDGADNALALSDHADHIHIGWQPVSPTTPSRPH